MFIQFAIGNARDGAWGFAEELSQKNPEEKLSYIRERDSQIKQLGTGMTAANFLLRVTLFIIHLFEWKKPSRIITALNDGKKTYFKLSAAKS
jgi:hypothetical protein